MPLPHISLGPALRLCSKRFKAAVAERKKARGREVNRECKGPRGGCGQRSHAVGDSQSGAYHCLSLIHHDREGESLKEREKEKEEKQRGKLTEKSKNRINKKFLFELYDIWLGTTSQSTRKEHPFQDLTTLTMSEDYGNGNGKSVFV